MPTRQDWVNGCTADGRDLTHDPRREKYAKRHPELTPQPCQKRESVLQHAERSTAVTPQAVGVGSHLEKIFAEWTRYIPITGEDDGDSVTAIANAGAASCIGCQGLAALMNRWGPDECERRIDDDPKSADATRHVGIVSRIKANAGKRKIAATGTAVSSIPFFEYWVKRFVMLAIAKARESTPGK